MFVFKFFAAVIAELEAFLTLYPNQLTYQGHTELLIFVTRYWKPLIRKSVHPISSGYTVKMFTRDVQTNLLSSHLRLLFTRKNEFSRFSANPLCIAKSLVMKQIYNGHIFQNNIPLKMFL